MGCEEHFTNAWELHEKTTTRGDNTKRDGEADEHKGFLNDGGYDKHKTGGKRGLTTKDDEDPPAPKRKQNETTTPRNDQKKAKSSLDSALATGRAARR